MTPFFYVIAMSDQADQDADEPKLVIDSDWKEQVQKEKEQASAAEQGGSAKQGGADSSGEEAVTAGTSPEAGDGDAQNPPPASFTVLVSMLFSQAMSLLGQLPGPDGKTEVNKPFAKHTIDTLEVLEEKTKGNLDDEEKQVLNEALHVLRMAFVNAKS